MIDLGGRRILLMDLDDALWGAENRVTVPEQHLPGLDPLWGARSRAWGAGQR